MAATRRTDRRRERGVTLVEAAFVLPVVVLFVFGVIEYGLFFSTTATATSATREGARTASTEFAPSSDKDVAADLVRRSVETALDGMTGQAEPLELMIYRANADGEPIGGFAGCSDDCWRYTWDDAADEFEVTGGLGWRDPDACIGDGDDLDSIGVYVRVRHDHVTGLFGSSRIVAHKTALRIEPLPLAQCSGSS